MAWCLLNSCCFVCHLPRYWLPLFLLHTLCQSETRQVQLNPWSPSVLHLSLCMCGGMPFALHPFSSPCLPHSVLLRAPSVCVRSEPPWVCGDSILSTPTSPTSEHHLHVSSSPYLPSVGSATLVWQSFVSSHFPHDSCLLLHAVTPSWKLVLLFSSTSVNRTSISQAWYSCPCL